jgi:hypothetical protein
MEQGVKTPCFPGDKFTGLRANETFSWSFKRMSIPLSSESLLFIAQGESRLNLASSFST